MNVIDVIVPAFAALALIFTLVKLNGTRNRPHQARSSGARLSSNGDEGNTALCETCQIPQMGDESTWLKLECGHCYHQHCMNLYASDRCISCELQEAERLASTRMDAGGC